MTTGFILILYTNRWNSLVVLSKFPPSWSNYHFFCCVCVCVDNARGPEDQQHDGHQLHARRLQGWPQDKVHNHVRGGAYSENLVRPAVFPFFCPLYYNWFMFKVRVPLLGEKMKTTSTRTTRTTYLHRNILNCEKCDAISYTVFMTLCRSVVHKNKILPIYMKYLSNYYKVFFWFFWREKERACRVYENLC